MDYEYLSTLIAWMNSPFENSGNWRPVDWWEQEMPEGMAETIVDLCGEEPRAELIEIRAGLSKLSTDKQHLEEKWGTLPERELCRYLQTDVLILRYLNTPIGVDANPIGVYGNIKELLDFLIDLDVHTSG